MSTIKIVPEKFVVQFLQFWPFIMTITKWRDLAQVNGALHGAGVRFAHKGMVVQSHSVQFSTYNMNIKGDIMAYNVVSHFNIMQKKSQYIFQRITLSKCCLGRYSVDSNGFRRNNEAMRTDNTIISADD